MLYRIITEGINADRIRAVLAAHGLDYSMFTGTGAYLGQRESTIAVDCLGVSRDQVAAAARDIGRVNAQECVLLVAIPCEFEFINTTVPAPEVAALELAGVRL